MSLTPLWPSTPLAVKHHVSSILGKTGVANRAGLATLVAEWRNRTAQSYGTKVL